MLNGYRAYFVILYHVYIYIHIIYINTVYYIKTTFMTMPVVCAPPPDVGHSSTRPGFQGPRLRGRLHDHARPTIAATTPPALKSSVGGALCRSLEGPRPYTFPLLALAAWRIADGKTLALSALRVGSWVAGAGVRSLWACKMRRNTGWHPRQKTCFPAQGTK